MAYNEVVEMLGENLASFLELAKKWLIEWKIDLKNLLHLFQNLKKDDLIGLLNGTHQIQEVSIPKVFKKTTVVNITKSPKTFEIQEKSVMNFLEPIIKREKELKNPTPIIDRDFWIYFNNCISLGFVKDFSSTIYKFIVNLTHRQIIEEADNLGIKKVYSYLEALSVIRQAILNGEVDKKEARIIVFFKKNDTLFRIRAHRDAVGCLNLRFDKVGLDDFFDAGDGACF